MEFRDYKKLVKSIPIGKQLPDAVYLHESAIRHLPHKLGKHLAIALIELNLDDEDWNIIKFFKRDHKLALLHYPSFFDDSYPALHQSITIDLENMKIRKADYSQSENPPILHRKETFLDPEHPDIQKFIEITEEGERAGLYENTRTIGFKQNWLKLISRKGYTLDKNGRLRLKWDTQEKSPRPITEIKVDRHLTAIDRNKLSQPMQALARHNYLNGEYGLLDYGCGKGDDVRELEAHGIDVIGWDPIHRPDVERSSRDIVNLGFVLNVIEDRQERTQTLINAWNHTEKILVVAVMVAGESTIRQFTAYKDGVITSRNTFQKYYSQGEIKYYIERTLKETAIAAGQGIFLIFKDKIEEQLFLSERQHIKRDWTQKTQRELSLQTKTIEKDVIDKNIELFNDYWETTLGLGRIPANDEFEFSDQIRRLCGSHNKAHQALIRHFGDEVFNEAKQKRKEDLIVYLALGMFEKRKPQTNIPESLKRDIKSFFSSYKDALNLAREALFSVGSPEIINEACITAYNQLKCGLMEDGHSFTFHKKYLGDLPPELRIYIGCATQLYGDIDEFQLIKAHIRSGKVSLMRYDSWSKDKPMLLERIKIKLRELDLEVFEYKEKHSPKPLTNKSKFTY